MKAVIMAGGEGRRLRAVSGERPKPLTPLLGRPIMEHIIELLRKEGFEDICAAVKYKAPDIEEHFGDGSRLGVRLQYRLEKDALGTAGAVKNCADFIGNEDVLVISGDAACDFSLSRLMQAHRETGAAVTMALYPHSSPLSYGLTVTDSENFVRAFVEKPLWPRVVSELVNTGIYIISPRVLELVPQGESFDFAKQLFPLLLEKGEKLLGLPMEGYWCDIGEPLSYYRCCADALEGKLKLEPAEEFKTAENSVSETAEEDSARVLEYRCVNRARLMGALSRALLEMDADYSDGIRLSSPRYSLHVSPLAARSAIRIAVASEDAEFADRLALSFRELAKALDI